MAAVMRHTVIVRHPVTFAPEALVKGTEVPEWAVDLIGQGDVIGRLPVADGAEGDRSVTYSAEEVTEIVAELTAENERLREEIAATAGDKSDGAAEQPEADAAADTTSEAPADETSADTEAEQPDPEPARRGRRGGQA